MLDVPPAGLDLRWCVGTSHEHHLFARGESILAAVLPAGLIARARFRGWLPADGSLHPACGRGEERRTSACSRVLLSLPGCVQKRGGSTYVAPASSSQIQMRRTAAKNDEWDPQGAGVRGVRASPACHLKNRWLTATTCLPYFYLQATSERAAIHVHVHGVVHVCSSLAASCIVHVIGVDVVCVCG